MSLLADTILVLLILTSFLLLGSSRLGACIRLGAWQGVLVALLPLAAVGTAPTPRIAALAALIAGLKGVVFPRLLFRALRESNASREVEPLVGYAASLLVGLLSLLASLWLDARLALPLRAATDLAAPVALFMIMTGLFLIVARRTAVNQVVGYLALENGIYAFGLALVRDIPALVELGVLMDVFVAVFVMGIAIYHIHREFDHMDAERLTALKG